MIGSPRRCLQLPDAELMMQPENMYLLVHHHHYRVALACDYQPYRFALWRDHELIPSRAVGMTFCRVWRGIWGDEGPRGKDSGALDARPFATRRVFHGVPKVRHPCSQTMRRRPKWIITSDPCQKEAPCRELSNTPTIPTGEESQGWGGSSHRP